MKKFMQFGDFSPINIEKKREGVASSRASVTSDGLESNTHTEYDHEVKFENIDVNVNVTRVKEGDDFCIGVAKGALMSGVPVTVPTNTAASTMHAMKKRCDYAPTLEDVATFKEGHKLLMSKFDPLDTIRVDKDLIHRYLERCSGGKAERLLAALSEHQLNSEMDKKTCVCKARSTLERAQGSATHCVSGF
jgi:hypothetical protein